MTTWTILSWLRLAGWVKASKLLKHFQNITNVRHSYEENQINFSNKLFMKFSHLLLKQL